VLELSLREALSLGHNYIGTEHVLMGLLREGEGVACRILTELGADAELLHSEVVAALGGPAVAPRPVPGRRVEPPRGRQLPPVALLAAGWLLFALALGAGILIGWAIWG